ncbi:hypothetical protein LK09_08235 [Microbacterium mangrovi]|uniref:Uncharacterized protein n=1 Tax=Microbacterium mangrovi TaxID=1348253 RepID=A0A0B2AB56_9MICO|nr:hypothetical protein [Microbacterium mangrovi]KHK98846.1 hypothetical protein LK09_08235 [Microbacterium mangrovi]
MSLIGIVEQTDPGQVLLCFIQPSKLRSRERCVVSQRTIAGIHTQTNLCDAERGLIVLESDSGDKRRRQRGSLREGLVRLPQNPGIESFLPCTAPDMGADLCLVGALQGAAVEAEVKVEFI